MRYIIASLLLLVACGEPTARPPVESDAGAVDAGETDAGPIDAGSSDGGTDGGVCFPETNLEGCSRLQVECGNKQAFDNCGTPRTFECGDDACQNFDTCGGGGTPNVCGYECTPKQFDPAMCTMNGPRCGNAGFPDGCHGTVSGDCGPCANAETCAEDGYCCAATDTVSNRCHQWGASCGTVVVMDAVCHRNVSTFCGDCPDGYDCTNLHVCKQSP
jgi:hypothetical protein